MAGKILYPTTGKTSQPVVIPEILAICTCLAKVNEPVRTGRILLSEKEIERREIAEMAFAQLRLADEVTAVARKELDENPELVKLKELPVIKRNPVKRMLYAWQKPGVRVARKSGRMKPFARSYMFGGKVFMSP